MANYLLSVWHDDDYELDFSSDEAKRQVAQVGQFNADLEAAGALLFGGGLQPASSASVIRVDGADVSTAEGAFAGSAPQMGGFWIIAADSGDGALAWGRRAARACERPVEVRPMQGG